MLALPYLRTKENMGLIALHKVIEKSCRYMQNCEELSEYSSFITRVYKNALIIGVFHPIFSLHESINL